MAAEVVPLPVLKLPSGPSPFTAEQRYWKSFKNQKSHTLTSSWPVTHISFPVSSVSSATATAASKQNDLFSVTAGPRVDVWSIRKREPLKTIGRFDTVARSGDIRPDSKVLVAGDDSGKMQVFDVGGSSRPVILKTWKTHKQPVWVTRWSPTELTTLMSASDDKTVKLWDLTSNDATHSFVGHLDYVRCGTFMTGTAASSNMIVTGSYDSTVRVWDKRTAGGSVLTFKHAAPIESVLSLSSGTTILASADNSISVLDLVAARPLRLISAHQKTVTSLCLASNGQRVLSGGLDGHVKVFETNSWNVVANARYPSPVLCVSVIPAGSSGEDRHLAVGMQSGVLSIKTRLSGSAAERDKERKLELAARDAGVLDQYDAAVSKRKRHNETRKRLDALGEGVDFVIGEDRKRRRKEPKWQNDLRHKRFGPALDAVLDPGAPDHNPLTTLSLLVALRHRSALRAALENRDEVTIEPVLKWITTHIIDPRYSGVCVDVGLHLIDLYSEYVTGSAQLENGFRVLRKRVRKEVEKAQVACETGGMLESLMMSVMAEE